LIIWQRTTPEGYNAVKAQGFVNRSPVQIFKVISNTDYRSHYDTTYDTGRLLERIADQTLYVHQKLKKIAVVAARDFMIVLHYNAVRELLEGLTSFYRLLMARSILS
jgi:CRISPR/Cas system endoribonuclease Cas6 (RAMP superfamily)